MSGEWKSYETEESETDTQSAEKALTGFRRIPDVEELGEDDLWMVKVHGVRAWLDEKDAADGVIWNEVADKAAALKLAGYEIKDIAELLHVDVKDLKRNVDLNAIDAALKGEAAKCIFKKAFEGDNAMLKLIATHKLDWTETKKVEHSGAIEGVQPVLNINLSTHPSLSDVPSPQPEIIVVDQKRITANGKKKA